MPRLRPRPAECKAAGPGLQPVSLTLRKGTAGHMTSLPPSPPPPINFCAFPNPYL